MNAATPVVTPQRIGFTGSRKGMTDAQRSAFGHWLWGRRFEEFHHGCCVGADAVAVLIVSEESISSVRIIGHPCDWAALTDKEACSRSAEMRSCRRALLRNRDIVDDCQLLVACPNGSEELRSGTWSTVRYARSIGRPVTIIWPDGRVEEEAAGPRGAAANKEVSQ